MTRLAATQILLRRAIRSILLDFSNHQLTALALIGILFSQITIPVRALAVSIVHPSSDAETPAAAPNAIAPPPILSAAERMAEVTSIDLNVRREVMMSVGQTLLLAGVPTNAQGKVVNGLTIDWRSGDSQIISINGTGEAVARQAGTARLVAKVGEVEQTIDVIVQSQKHASEQDTKAAIPNILSTSKTVSREQDSASGLNKNRSLKNHRLATKTSAAVLLLPQPQPSPPEGDGLPPEQTNSLYAASNIVGKPPARTEMGAATPPASIAGEENPGSSNFSFNVPVAGLPGRGISVSLGLTYNSRMWNKYESEGSKYLTYDVDGGWPSPGFNLGYGHLDAQGSYGYTLVDPNGTRHQMLKPTSNSAYYESTDGTFVRLTIASNVPTVIYTDGTQMLYSTANSASRSYPVKITDRNGNFIEISYKGGHGPELYTVKDTLNRYVRFYYDESDTTFGSKLVSVTVPKFGTSASTPDEQQTIRLYYTAISVGETNGFGSGTYGNAFHASVRALSDVYFPGTGSGYHYEYSTVYGMIRKIAERRGMTVNTTATDQQGAVTSVGQLAASTEYNYPDQASALTDAPTFTRRTDDWAGRTTGMPNTGEAPYYLFQVTETPVTTDASLRYSRVTAPDGTITTSVSTVQPGQWYDGVVSANIIELASGTRLSQVDYDWQAPSANSPMKLNFVKFTNEVGQARKIVYSSYDDYNNPGVVSELDFSTAQGDGPELRRTETIYETGQNWLGRRLVSLLKSVKVFKGGTSILAAQADYEYDATALTSRPGMSASSNPGIYRGNLTSVKTYANAAAGESGGTILNTMEYDIAGNIVLETVNCCRQKSFAYDSAYNYAYPLSVTRGLPPLQLTASAVYDYNTGAVVSAKDENEQITTYEYDAVTLLNTRVNRPDGGSTSVAYHDGLSQDGTAEERHSYITTTTKLDSGREVTSLQYFDGRGATVRTFGAETTSGREGTVDVEYDVMGRAYRTSNPYYATNGAATPINPSGIWTTREFDQLGRVTTIRTPSGETTGSFCETVFNYYGTQITATDAAGYKRRQTMDALGRLVRLDEPNNAGSLDGDGGPVQPTAYEYDALDNLIHVTQAGPNGITQNRYFKFDSMSRMTHARQVEQDAPYVTSDSVANNNQWSSYFEYDAQGKVEYTYDARGIRTHFLYDGLNRLQEVSYSKQSGGQWVAEGTPTTTFTYDADHPGFSGYLNKGRLTQVKTAATDTIPQTIQDYDYDQMGRVRNHRQKIGLDTSYQILYDYNLAGQLVSETYPSMRIVTTNYDGAGRLSNLSDTINQQPARTLVSDFTYAGHGGLLSENLGNNTVHSLSYNDALQLRAISLTKGSELLQRYEYRYGQINMESGALDETKNNGQVARIEGFIGGTSQAPIKQWQQRFHYDSLGRLDQAAEYRGDSGTLAYQSNYQYDRWGNRALPQNLNGHNLAFTPVEDSDIEKSTNRFKSSTGTVYDGTGNVTSDSKFRGLRYEYDANGRQRSSTPLTSGIWQEASVYDGLGQRIQNSSNGTIRNMVYDAFGNMISEYGGQPSGAGGLQFVISDHQGSTRVVMNRLGDVQTRHDYQPFGEEIGFNVGQRTGDQHYGFSDETTARYTGMEQDGASGLNHTWFRKYESQAGRWTSPDPYGGSISVSNPQSFNRYSYVENDPINQVDPTGLERKICGHFDDGSPVYCDEIVHIQTNDHLADWLFVINSLFGGYQTQSKNDLVIEDAITKAEGLLKKKSCQDFIESLLRQAVTKVAGAPTNPAEQDFFNSKTTTASLLSTVRGATRDIQPNVAGPENSRAQANERSQSIFFYQSFFSDTVINEIRVNDDPRTVNLDRTNTQRAQSLIHEGLHLVLPGFTDALLGEIISGRPVEGKTDAEKRKKGSKIINAAVEDNCGG
jgi:RHS repeat-associated protein